MAYEITIDAFRGSDILRTLVLKGENDVPINLTGRTVSVFDASEGIEGRVSAELDSPIDGRVQLVIEGTIPIKRGRHRFRLQITDPSGETIDGLSRGFPPFILRVY